MGGLARGGGTGAVTLVAKYKPTPRNYVTPGGGVGNSHYVTATTQHWQLCWCWSYQGRRRGREWQRPWRARGAVPCESVVKVQVTEHSQKQSRSLRHELFPEQSLPPRAFRPVVPSQGLEILVLLRGAQKSVHNTQLEVIRRHWSLERAPRQALQVTVESARCLRPTHRSDTPVVPLPGHPHSTTVAADEQLNPPPPPPPPPPNGTTLPVTAYTPASVTARGRVQVEFRDARRGAEGGHGQARAPAAGLDGRQNGVAAAA